MYDAIYSLPDHIQKALSLPLKNFVPSSFKGIHNIVFLGMGGSGIVGNIIKDLIDTIPIFLSKGYTPPSFLDRNTLAICVSYSGNTKETLSSYQTALEKNCHILGVTSGGKLLKALVAEGKPHIPLPTGFLPRVSLPYQLFSLLNFFEKLGLYKLEKEKVITFIENHKKGMDSKAKDLATRLKGKIPFIYGTSESPCLRFKTQLNENAKVHAKYELFPELNHNEVMGWQSSPSNISVVLFREKGEREEIKTSIEFLKDSLKGKTDIIEIFSEGENKLEKILYFILLGDLMSYYLAQQQGTNPETMEYINALKKIIKERPQ